MRKIKFRAYHKKQKKMYYNVEKTYDYGCNGDNDVLAESFAEILEDNNYDIMQYTGIEDVGGNEIFEGDILKDADVIYKIIFRNGGFYAKVVKVIKDVGIQEGLEYAMSIIEEWNDTEVIGNIYDNPELLEKE